LKVPAPKLGKFLFPFPIEYARRRSTLLDNFLSLEFGVIGAFNNA